jgi:hypothetical protein
MLAVFVFHKIRILIAKQLAKYSIFMSNVVLRVLMCRFNIESVIRWILFIKKSMKNSKFFDEKGNAVNRGKEHTIHDNGIQLKLAQPTWKKIPNRDNTIHKR